MSILEFFDVYNYEHLQAFKKLGTSGMWPGDFIPNGTTFTTNWLITLMSRMAEAWVVHNDECYKGGV